MRAVEHRPLSRPRSPSIALSVPLLLLAAASALGAQEGSPAGDGPAYSFALSPRVAPAGEAREAGSRAPEPGTLFLYPERFEKADGSLGSVDRGVLFVPLNRSDPENGIVAVEFWRFRAEAGTPSSAPPIFRLRGGPGWPGLSGSLEEEGYFEESIEPFLRVSDFVMVGQRGFGSSKPKTDCTDLPASPEDEEVSAEEWREIVREAAAGCRRWWEERGLDLSGYTVIEMAADVDAVRRALGYEEIAIWSGSFGSHWGMAVMRTHPEIVARAVLTGTEGPNHTYDSPTGVLNVYERIAADAEDSPAFAPHVPEGGLIAAHRETIRRLEREPVTVRVGREEGDSVVVTLDGEAARNLTTGAYLGEVGDRRDAASWPLGIVLLHRGEYRTAARRLAPSAEATGGGFWVEAAFFMLDCGSGITPERERALLEDPAREVVGEQNWFYRTFCPVWDSDLGDRFRRNFDTEIPTVIVHGSWDSSTPLENALELAPHFRNGKLIVIERGTHGALGEAMDEFPEFREALFRFVATGSTDALPDGLELPEPDWVTPGELETEEVGGG